MKAILTNHTRMPLSSLQFYQHWVWVTKHTNQCLYLDRPSLLCFSGWRPQCPFCALSLLGCFCSVSVLSSSLLCPFLFLLLLKKLGHFFTWYNFPQNSVYIIYKTKLPFHYHQPGFSLSISKVLVYHSHISHYIKCLLQKYVCLFFLNTSLL